MTPLFPRSVGSVPDGPPPHGLVDHRQDRQAYRARWSAQAARWRALELVHVVFGPEARVRLEGTPGRPGLQGLLHIEVPFAGLEDHREREAFFLSAAKVDELLQAVPLLFVFGVASLDAVPGEGLPPLPPPVAAGGGGES
jgi:hypothetical protein